MDPSGLFLGDQCHGGTALLRHWCVSPFIYKILLLTITTFLGETMVRYVKLRWLSHHGSEDYCTLTSLKVYGTRFLATLDR